MATVDGYCPPPREKPALSSTVSHPSFTVVATASLASPMEAEESNTPAQSSLIESIPAEGAISNTAQMSVISDEDGVPATFLNLTSEIGKSDNFEVKENNCSATELPAVAVPLLTFSQETDLTVPPTSKESLPLSTTSPMATSPYTTPIEHEGAPMSYVTPPPPPPPQTMLDQSSARTVEKEYSPTETPFKIFVGGLGRNSTQDSLREHFQQFGNVVDASVIIDKITGRSRGFGFATFDSEEAVKCSLDTKHYIDGVAVDVRNAVPREEAKESVPYDTIDQPGRVFVGGLSDEITEEIFREHFSQFGTLKSSNLMYDKDNHCPRGFGFVIYENPADADKSLGEHELLGRNCEAKKALPRPLYNRNRQNSPHKWGNEGRNYNPRYGNNSYGAEYNDQMVAYNYNRGYGGGYNGYYDSNYNPYMAAYYTPNASYGYGYSGWNSYGNSNEPAPGGGMENSSYSADRSRRNAPRTTPY
ncbi:hypothetical protein IE077_003981 [Cardiosporidium cionae]|uniref:RRM domain-containing protein n=1 Tax=Cardiosporidium cionae TaxID=476202 RepID=A0ABQ7JE84_9APIC|nr:hypothetical protein IE077_003981 [Cardiosporidium cionae]|eukprot:KAF8822327.1 hypothetical protein IE077_003981 [Cardiosporidium cionae]